MGQLLCGTDRVLEGRITLTRAGAWYADLRLDTQTKPTGLVTITADNGFSLTGTVAFGDVWQGHADVRIEAGHNGFDSVIDARYYRNPTIRILLQDAARDSGETLDASISNSLLSTTIPAWTRRRATLASVLGDIVRYACPTGTKWRTLANGNIWVGTDTYSTTVDAGVFELMDYAPSELLVGIGCDNPITALIPGVQFRFSDDYPAGRISQVEHKISAEATSTMLWLDDPNFGDRVWSPIARSMGQVLAGQRFLTVYTGAVTQVNADNTCDVQLDDPTALVGLSGTPRLPNPTAVPIRAFGPNVKVIPTAGARVELVFEDGSPAKPVITGFETGSASGSYEIGNSPQFTALANLVNSRLSDIVTWANTHKHTGVQTGGGTSAITDSTLGPLADVSCTKLKTE